MKIWILATVILAAISCEEEPVTKADYESKLADLMEEIDDLSNAQSCENAEEWSFTALGAKACGGPMKYVAYSTKIDTAKFRELVTEYTSLQKSYNEKFNIISDCMMMMPPTGIYCENGEYKFSYDR